MAPIAETDPDFVFQGLPPIEEAPPDQVRGRISRTANTAFLTAAANPPGGNAKAAEVDATFWIETVAGAHGQPDTLQLQYTQLVQLDFNGLRWPHVTVATLHKQ